jgi:hypothetical protein
MKLRIENYKSVVGTTIGNWSLIDVDELDFTYAFWFDCGDKGLKPVILNREGDVQWDSLSKKGIWTYKVMDGGMVTADWFTPKNALSIFESVLKMV